MIIQYIYVFFFSSYFCFIGFVYFLWTSDVLSLTDHIGYPFLTLFYQPIIIHSLLRLFIFASNYLIFYPNFGVPPPPPNPPTVSSYIWGVRLILKFPCIYSCVVLFPLLFNCICSSMEAYLVTFYFLVPVYVNFLSW